MVDLKRFWLVAAGLIAGFAGGLLGTLAYNQIDSANSPNSLQQSILGESELVADIAKKVGQGVVSIEVRREVNARNIFGFDIPDQRGAGTGFIIDVNGTIVTNRHVVPAGTTSVSVTLADGTRYDDVAVIGRSASSLDVAFLKIGDLKGKKLRVIKLGDSSKVEIGERVVAIGNALGQFQNSVTTGIISGHSRDVLADGEGGVEALTNLFQTDAAINQGNSGGPLVNVNGEVIAINTAVAGGAENIGFAIPINDVRGLIKSVLEKGRMEQPFLGVRYVSLTDDIAVQNNLKVKRGAYILPPPQGEASIVSGSPAAQAGLQAGDIITKVNNITIDERTSLSSALNRFQVGETVRLTIIRGDETITRDVTLAALPQN